MGGGAGPTRVFVPIYLDTYCQECLDTPAECGILLRMDTYGIEVGFTTTRPVIVDEFIRYITLAAGTDQEAKQTAAQWVGSEYKVEMVTSTKIIWIEC